MPSAIEGPLVIGLLPLTLTACVEMAPARRPGVLTPPRADIVPRTVVLPASVMFGLLSRMPASVRTTLCWLCVMVVPTGLIVTLGPSGFTVRPRSTVLRVSSMTRRVVAF